MKIRVGQSWFYGSDFSSGLLVFLIAIPLCLGIAFASQAPLSAGLISGVVGALFVGVLSSSRIGISSPAAGLIVVVIEGIRQLGAWEKFLVAVVLAGGFQVLLGIMRTGKMRYLFPKPVIRGLLCGIGLIVIIKQIPLLFGLSDFSPMWKSHLNVGCILLSVMSLAVLALCNMQRIKSSRFSAILQGPIVAVALSLALALWVFPFIPGLMLEKQHFVTMPMIKNISSWKAFFSMPDFSALHMLAVYKTAIMLALIASIESLLCVEAMDDLDHQHPATPMNRELVVQGFGNIVCGLVGGLPIVQEIVRSSTNLHAGAVTRRANWIHGALLLLTILFFSSFLQFIPLAVLATILIFVGVRLINVKQSIHFLRSERVSSLGFLVTTIGIVTLNLLAGVMMGIVVVYCGNWKNRKIKSAKIEVSGQTMRLIGNFHFHDRVKISHTLDQKKISTIDVSNVGGLDGDVVQYLKKLELHSNIQINPMFESLVL